jgi:hypothetical protein
MPQYWALVAATKVAMRIKHSILSLELSKISEFRRDVVWVFSMLGLPETYKKSIFSAELEKLLS